MPLGHAGSLLLPCSLPALEKEPKRWTEVGNRKGKAKLQATCKKILKSPQKRFLLICLFPKRKRLFENCFLQSNVETCRNLGKRQLSVKKGKSPIGLPVGGYCRWWFLWLTPVWTVTCVSPYAVGRQPAQHRRGVELERLRCRGHGSRARLQPCSRPLGRWIGDHQGHHEPGALSSVRRILRSLPWLPSICHWEWHLPNG